jgi:hypothetical protein
VRKQRPWLREIPKSNVILEEVLRELQKENFEDKIKNNQISLSQAAQLLEKKCYERYLRYEEEVKKRYSTNTDYNLGDIEFSLSQSRVARAGNVVEMILQYLLKLLNVPYEGNVRYPKTRNGESLDIVIPNTMQLQTEPTKAVIISVKREVRERWREVVGEAYILREIHKVPDNIWFVTITCDISKYIVDSMNKLNIRVYVPDECFKKFEKFGAHPFSKIFDDLIKFLKDKGINHDRIIR